MSRYDQQVTYNNRLMRLERTGDVIILHGQGDNKTFTPFRTQVLAVFALVMAFLLIALNSVLADDGNKITGLIVILCLMALSVVLGLQQWRRVNDSLFKKRIELHPDYLVLNATDQPEKAVKFHKGTIFKLSVHLLEMKMASPFPHYHFRVFKNLDQELFLDFAVRLDPKDVSLPQFLEIWAHSCHVPHLEELPRPEYLNFGTFVYTKNQINLLQDRDQNFNDTHVVNTTDFLRLESLKLNPYDHGAAMVSAKLDLKERVFTHNGSAYDFDRISKLVLRFRPFANHQEHEGAGDWAVVSFAVEESEWVIGVLGPSLPLAAGWEAKSQTLCLSEYIGLKLVYLLAMRTGLPYEIYPLEER